MEETTLSVSRGRREFCESDRIYRERDFFFLREGKEVMGDGSSRRAALMDHEHREETPILRKCQEFSRELLAFAITATRTRVRGSVTFLLGCDARSIAASRAFLRVYPGTGDNDDDGDEQRRRRRRRDERFTRRSARNERTDRRDATRRDKTSVTRACIGTTRPLGTTREEASRRRRWRRLTYDCRHLAADRRRSLKWKAPRGRPSAD